MTICIYSGQLSPPCNGHPAFFRFCQNAFHHLILIIYISHSLAFRLPAVAFSRQFLCVLRGFKSTSINGVQFVKLLFNNSQLFLNFLKYIRCPRIDVFQSQAFSFQFTTQVFTMHKPICFHAHWHFGLFAVKTLGVYNALLIYFVSISCAPNPMFCEASKSCIGSTPFFLYLLIQAFTFKESTRFI